MGACDFTQIVVTNDIYSEIGKLCEECVRYIEDPQDIPYSGGINTIDFIRRYSKTFEDENEMYDFIDTRLNKLEKREGEIVELGTEYYVKAYSVFRDCLLKDFKARCRLSDRDLSSLHSKFKGEKKYLLVDETGSFYSSYETISEAKKYANFRMLNEKFKIDYYILSKSKVLLCTGVGDVYDKEPTSSKDYLIIPYKKYLLFGWASE